MADFNPADAVTMSAGNVEYSAEEAAITIDDLIGSLESAKSEGATHVVQSSGNYRGAKWMHTSRQYEWAEDFNDGY